MGRRISTLSYCDRGARSPPTPAPSAVMALVSGLSVSVAPDEDIGGGAASCKRGDHGARCSLVQRGRPEDDGNGDGRSGEQRPRSSGGGGGLIKRRLAERDLSVQPASLRDA